MSHLGTDAACVVLVGSQVAGYGHARSDIDVYVFSNVRDKFTDTLNHDGQRIDLEHFNAGWLRDLFSLFRDVEASPGSALKLDLGSSTWASLLRLMCGQVIHSSEAFSDLARDLASLRRRILECFGLITTWEVVTASEDLVGFQEDSDVISFAALENTLVWRCLDVLMALRDQPFPGDKWRVAKLRQSEWSQCVEWPLMPFWGDFRRLQVLNYCLQIELWGPIRFRPIVTECVGLLGRLPQAPVSSCRPAPGVLSFGGDDGLRLVDTRSLFERQSELQISSYLLSVLAFMLATGCGPEHALIRLGFNQSKILDAVNAQLRLLSDLGFVEGGLR
ncbi:hypothetical protein [Trueperella pyogenes]|uniref:Polymerase nucleotidyl transferase domain-containing protein n=1 Tax=Trueperella pyogenes TaxID=1661 RepID=A0ABV3NCI6_9ACTO